MSLVRDTALEAEARIVSICTTWPPRIDLVTAEPHDFGSLKWRACFVALRELRLEHDGEIDSIILADRVTESVGQAISYSDLINLDANPYLVESYSEIVREEAAKRRLTLGLSEVVSTLKDGTTINDALSRASLAISDATMGQPDDALSIGDIVKQRYHMLAEIAKKLENGDTSATGISTGIDHLDEVLGGIQKGIVTLVAARPAMGKSALALNLANTASLAGTGVHKFSLEDTRSAYADRVMSLGSGVNSRDIRSCKLNAGQLGQLAQAGEKAVKRKNWIVDDRSGITAAEVVRCVRRNAAANGTQMVIVDYIQLLRGSKGQGQREMLSEAINTFGDAAKHDDMAYVVLSQLNRGLESRDNKRPMLSDLKESGTLEERAKAALMLYRPAVYGDKYSQGQYRGKERPGQNTGMPVPESVIEILVRKNSNGMTGTVLATWEPERMRIR